MRPAVVAVKSDPRSELLRLVQAQPGLHLSAIARHLGWSTTLAEYHLRVLEHDELVTSLQVENQRRFFPRVQRHGLVLDLVAAGDKRLFGVLRHPVRSRLVATLARNGPTRHSELAKQLGLSRPAASYHLGRLERRGVVARTEHGVYTIVEASGVRAAIQRLGRTTDATSELRSVFDGLW
jgi:predicted transcriptional regulator